MCEANKPCDAGPKNLAQPTCTKKTNLLVYERQKGEECNRPRPKSYVPPISSPRIKRIRICTGAELKKMCPPPPCPCPPKIPRPTLLQRLMRVTKFGMKGLLALGAVYVSYDMGIWGDSDTTGELYKSVCEEILPRIIEAPKAKPVSPACSAESDLFNAGTRDPFCCDKFPIDSESGMYELKQKWNKVVGTMFSGLVGVPTTLSGWTKQAYCNVFNAESCRESTKEDDDDCVPCEIK